MPCVVPFTQKVPVGGDEMPRSEANDNVRELIGMRCNDCAHPRSLSRERGRPQLSVKVAVQPGAPAMSRLGHKGCVPMLPGYSMAARITPPALAMKSDSEVPLPFSTACSAAGAVSHQAIQRRGIVMGQSAPHLRRQAAHLPFDRVARVRPHAVGMRIVRCP